MNSNFGIPTDQSQSKASNDGSAQGGDKNSNANSGADSNQLEHALLETIFYNEMMMMEDMDSMFLPDAEVEPENTQAQAQAQAQQAQAQQIQIQMQPQVVHIQPQVVHSHQVHPAQQIQNAPAPAPAPAPVHMSQQQQQQQQQLQHHPATMHVPQSHSHTSLPSSLLPQPIQPRQTAQTLQQAQHPIQHHVPVPVPVPAPAQPPPAPGFVNNPIRIDRNANANANANAEPTGTAVYNNPLHFSQPQSQTQTQTHIQPKSNINGGSNITSSVPNITMSSSVPLHVVNGNNISTTASNGLGPGFVSVPVPAPAPAPILHQNQTVNGQVYYTTQPMAYSNANANANATVNSDTNSTVSVQSNHQHQHQHQHQPIHIQPAGATTHAPAPIMPVGATPIQPKLNKHPVNIMPHPSATVPQIITPGPPPNNPQTYVIQQHQQQPVPIQPSRAPVPAPAAPAPAAPAPAPVPVPAQTQYTQQPQMHQPQMHQPQHQPQQPQQPQMHQPQHQPRQPQMHQPQMHQPQMHQPQHQAKQPPMHQPQQHPQQSPMHQPQQHPQQILHPTTFQRTQSAPQQHTQSAPQQQTQILHQPQRIASKAPVVQLAHTQPLRATTTVTPTIQHPQPRITQPRISQNNVQPGAGTRVSLAEQAKAELLVAQFQTLASRLGISLPHNVLTDLTTAAAINEANSSSKEEPAIRLEPPSSAIAQVTSNGIPSPSESNNIPDFMKQLQDTAEAAISAVDSRKRKASDEDEDGDDRLGPAAPIKRKKKATKEDCERRLRDLREENETLKRHLEMVRNKTAQFKKKRKMQEQNMKQLVLLSSKGNNIQYQKELRASLNQFTETYSDYGKIRQDELFFHLNQLEKSAAPTTFTKMSLWTLGQNESFFTQPKHHPISGILRKELDITPAQVRKIVAQRFKIQALCQNIKEVLQLIADLKALCQKKQKVFSDRMSKCQEILRPEQVTRLLVWIDDHAGVLESVCPGWGSERIQEQEQRGKGKGKTGRKGAGKGKGKETQSKPTTDAKNSPSNSP